MLVDGEIIKDGSGMIRYLDRKLGEIAAQGKTASAIVISTELRLELTRACQAVVNKRYDPVETVNKYRGVMLIEDGESEGRLEVIYGPRVTPPVELSPFGRVR